MEKLRGDPIWRLRQFPSIAIDDEIEITANGLKKIARKMAEITSTVKSERAFGRDRREGTRAVAMSASSACASCGPGRVANDRALCGIEPYAWRKTNQ